MTKAPRAKHDVSVGKSISIPLLGLRGRCIFAFATVLKATATRGGHGEDSPSKRGTSPTRPKNRIERETKIPLKTVPKCKVRASRPARKKGKRKRNERKGQRTP